MHSAAREYGTQSTLYKQCQEILAYCNQVLTNIQQEVTQVQQGCVDLKKIQAPRKVQQTAPQPQRSSYMDTQAFSDQNLGSSKLQDKK